VLPDGMQKVRPAAVKQFREGQGDVPTRTQVLDRIVGLTPLQGSIVIATTGYTGRELYALCDRANQLYVVGSMGCASSLALGLSMARPDLRVTVIDGDGAALMRLGNFATIGAYGGSNLVHIVLDNGVHESTGGQATVSSGMSFAKVAQACGYGLALEGDDLALLDALNADGSDAGARFGVLKIKRGTPAGLPRPDLTPVQVRDRLMSHIGAAPSADWAVTG
jgi:phosphonopyruvate decarboxylase